jgi:general stress protein 26
MNELQHDFFSNQSSRHIMINQEMTLLKKSNISLFIIFLVIPFLSFSQQNEPTDSVQNKLKIAALDIMTASNTCALITLDQEGRPRARTMDPFLPEDDFSVWFGTNQNSRKVDQIKNDPRVTLYYTSKDDGGYVMMYGIAEIVNDPEEKAKRWKEEWVTFYPDRTKDYILLKVTPEWIEVVSYAHNITGNPKTWEPPAIFFESEK